MLLKRALAFQASVGIPNIGHPRGSHWKVPTLQELDGPTFQELSDVSEHQELSNRRHVAAMHRHDVEEIPLVRTSPIQPQQKITLLWPVFDLLGNQRPPKRRTPGASEVSPGTTRIPTLLHPAGITASHPVGSWILPIKHNIRETRPVLQADNDKHLIFEWLQVCWHAVLPDPRRGCAPPASFHSKRRNVLLASTSAFWEKHCEPSLCCACLGLICVCSDSQTACVAGPVSLCSCVCVYLLYRAIHICFIGAISGHPGAKRGQPGA
jgi:hypothetical protein